MIDVISEKRLKELEYNAAALGVRAGLPMNEHIEMYRQGKKYETGKREVIMKFDRKQAVSVQEITKSINDSRKLYVKYSEEFVDILMAIGLLDVDGDTIYLMREYRPYIPKELR